MTPYKTNRKKTYPKRKRFALLISSFVLIALILFSAGCINSTSNEIESTEVEIPNDMLQGILDFSKDLSTLDRLISIDLYNLADKFGSSESDEEIESIGFEYYANNAWVTELIYYDVEEDKFIEIPNQIDLEITKYIPVPTEEKLVSAGGIIHSSAVFVPEKGYIDLNYVAVYDKNGKYKGYFVLSYEYYVLLNLHPAIIGKEKSYGDCMLFLVDNKDGKIVFSTKPETIGEYVSKDEPFYDATTLIKYNPSKAGAYQYSTMSFYNYNKNIDTDKITSWEDITAYKTSYRVYLTKELNQPPVVTKGVYMNNAAESRANVLDLYKYEAQAGIDAAIARVNSGYYPTEMVILDMEGTVLADQYGKIGLNYLNNHGTYGYLYTKGMIYTAEQGGGYVYYTFPVEGVVDAKIAQFTNSYVLPLDKNCFVVGLFTAGTDIINVDSLKKENTVSTSRDIIKRVYEKGFDTVVDEINNNRNWKYFAPEVKTEITDISILNFNGLVYASINNPDKVGKVVTDYTDIYGGSTTRKAIMLAKSGGGFMLDLTANTEQEGYVDLWLLSIEPMSSETYVVSQSLIGTFKDLLTPVMEV